MCVCEPFLPEVEAAAWSFSLLGCKLSLFRPFPLVLSLFLSISLLLSLRGLCLSCFGQVLRTGSLDTTPLFVSFVSSPAVQCDRSFVLWSRFDPAVSRSPKLHFPIGVAGLMTCCKLYYHGTFLSPFQAALITQPGFLFLFLSFAPRPVLLFCVGFCMGFLHTGCKKPCYRNAIT